MIYATGNFNGKLYDESLIQVKDVIKHFGLPFDGSSDAEFTLADHLIRQDELNKAVRHRQRSYESPSISGTYKNEAFTLVFCDGPPVIDRKTGAKRFSPDHQVYPGRDVLAKRTDLERQVFLYLNPKCDASPVRQGLYYEWRFIDRKADAKRENDAMNIVMQIAAEISSEQDLTKLKRIAKGLKFIVKDKEQIETITIPAPRINDDEVKAQLVKLSMKYPVEFSLAYRDSNLMLEGSVIDAIDAGLLIHQSVGGGMSKWFWTVGDRQEFCTVSNGVDPKAALLNHVHSERGYATFVEVLETQSNFRYEPKAVPRKEFKDMEGEELAEAALAAGVLEYVRDKKAYQIVKPDGELDAQSVCKIEDPSKRKWELSLAIGKGKGLPRNKVVKALSGEFSEDKKED